MLNGIINTLGAILALCDIRKATGMKMAVTAVELMIEPSPHTAAIRREISRLSLRPLRVCQGRDQEGQNEELHEQCREVPKSAAKWRTTHGCRP